LGKLFFIRNFVMSKIGEIVNWVNYFFIKNKYGSISAAIIEPTITAMYNKWPNKNKTHQLKLTNKLSKANSAIITST
jgi:hypothetical protein